MLLTSALLTGGAIYAGARAYRSQTRRKKAVWLHSEREADRAESFRLPLIDELMATLETFKAEKLDPLLLNERRQQLATLAASPQLPEISEAEQEVNRGLVIAVGSLGLAGIGSLIYPPLGIIGAPGILLFAMPVFQQAFKEIRDERKVTMTTLDSVMIAGTILLQQYVAMAGGVCMILFSEKLRLRTQDHSKKSLIRIFGEQPRQVWVQRDQVEIETALEDLQVGDVVVVHAGEMLPVDGTITEGFAMIDQHLLTGEAQPAEKGVGDTVFASTVMLSGKIYIEVKHAGQDTVAAQIGDILSRTTDFKSAVQLRAEGLSDRVAPFVLLLSVTTLALLGPISAIATLFASFGYDLRLTAPVSILNFLRMASQNGILVKDGRALEILRDVDTIVFDKTGTLTLEQPHIGKIYTCGGVTEDDLLTYAAAAEYKQSHPIARAIVQEAHLRELVLPTIDDAQYDVGYGIKVQIADHLIRVGSGQFMHLEGITIPSDVVAQLGDGREQGYSFVYIAVDDQLGGAIELHATIRPEAERVIQDLQQRNLALYIISGDQERPTRKLADELGIEHYFAETLPENKAKLIEQLQQEGRTVCFVGDGINDAVALKQAQVSVSLLGASTAATDTAQIILMNQNLDQLRDLLDLTSKLELNMNRNIGLAFASGICCISGIYLMHFGIISAIILTSGFQLIGIGNAALPLVRGQEQLTAGSHNLE